MQPYERHHEALQCNQYSCGRLRHLRQDYKATPAFRSARPHSRAKTILPSRGSGGPASQAVPLQLASAWIYVVIPTERRTHFRRNEGSFFDCLVFAHGRDKQGVTGRAGLQPRQKQCLS
jgi:hypothetical protein